KNREEQAALERIVPNSSHPANQRWQRSRNPADQGVQGTNPLHRRVNKQVDRDRDQRQEGGANVREEEEHRQPRNGEKQTEKERITWMHPFRRERTLLCALHERIELPFPQWVERGRATGTQRRAYHRRSQDQIVHWSLP